MLKTSSLIALTPDRGQAPARRVDQRIVRLALCQRKTVGAFPLKQAQLITELEPGGP
jgi:hypothetical protein